MTSEVELVADLGAESGLSPHTEALDTLPGSSEEGKSSTYPSSANDLDGSDNRSVDHTIRDSPAMMSLLLTPTIPSDEATEASVASPTLGLRSARRRRLIRNLNVFERN